MISDHTRFTAFTSTFHEGSTSSRHRGVSISVALHRTRYQNQNAVSISERSWQRYEDRCAVLSLEFYFHLLQSDMCCLPYPLDLIFSPQSTYWNRNSADRETVYSCLSYRIDLIPSLRSMYWNKNSVGRMTVYNGLFRWNGGRRSGGNSSLLLQGSNKLFQRAVWLHKGELVVKFQH